LPELNPEDAQKADEALQQMKRIEAEFEELKRRLFEEKLEEVKEEISQAQQGTIGGFGLSTAVLVSTNQM
jgi:hypothetical protein